jgi:hypothetical protein
MVKFQAFGRMDGHDRDLFGVIIRLIVHDQRDMLKEIAQRLVIFHRAGQFRQVFQTPRASALRSA